MRVKIGSQPKGRRTVDNAVVPLPEVDAVPDAEGAGETQSEEAKIGDDYMDETTGDEEMANEEMANTTRTPTATDTADQDTVDAPQTNEATHPADQAMAGAIGTNEATDLADQDTADAPQTNEATHPVDLAMADVKGTNEATDMADQDTGDAPQTNEATHPVDQAMADAIGTNEATDMADQNTANAPQTNESTHPVDQAMADAIEMTQAPQLDTLFSNIIVPIVSNTTVPIDNNNYEGMVAPPQVTEEVISSKTPLQRAQPLWIGMTQAPQLDTLFSNIIVPIVSNTTVPIDNNNYEGMVAPPQVTEEVLSSKTPLQRAQPLWIVPDEVASRGILAPEDPKGLHSDLAQRCFEVTLMFVAKYPMCKRIGVEFLEYLVRTTTDDELHEGVIASRNVLHGDWYTALPIAGFKYICISRSLLYTLGSMGGFKKSNAKLFNDISPTKDRFWVVHNNGRKAGIHFGGKDKQIHKLIQKLQNKMSLFVSSQFNVFSAGEKESVENGLINERDTIYIVGLDNGAVYHIIAVVQFVATKHGAFITWLAVLHQAPTNVYFGPNKQSTESFRRLGIASFLQEQVQLLLIARGWKPDFYLQSNVKSPARNYYEKRGYKRAPSNSLSSIPGLSEDAFPMQSINFVSDEIQVVNGIDAKERLQLFYHQGPLVSSFLEPSANSIVPEDDSDVVLDFPFNWSGNAVDLFTKGEDIYLMAETTFGAIEGVEYALRDIANEASINQDLREEGMYATIYDGAEINQAQYNALSDTTKALTDEHVDFFSAWILRHHEGAVFDDVAIIPLNVCKSFVACLDYLNDEKSLEDDPEVYKAALQHMTTVDKYLFGHPTLLQKRLIFMVVDFEPESWLGFVAINPFVRLILWAGDECRDTPEFSDYWSSEDYEYGMVCNHSDRSADPTDTQSLTVLWFLNLASRYRDLRLHGEHLLFNFEKMVLHGVPIFHFMLLGAEGPFGKLHKLDSKVDFVYPLLERDPRFGFYNNGHSCQGPSAWCLFVYDTILSLNGKSLLHDDKVVPLLGLYCHSDRVLRTPEGTQQSDDQEHSITDSLYLLLRAEMRITIERLRFLYLDNADIVIPLNWGGVSDAHKSYVSRAPFTTLVQPLFERNQARRKRATNYTKERQYRTNIFDSKYQCLTNTKNILHGNEFAGHCLREGMFDEGLQHLVGVVTEASQKKEQWVDYLLKRANIAPDTSPDTSEAIAAPAPAPMRGKPDPPLPVTTTTSPLVASNVATVTQTQ